MAVDGGQDDRTDFLKAAKFSFERKSVDPIFVCILTDFIEHTLLC